MDASAYLGIKGEYNLSGVRWKDIKTDLEINFTDWGNPSLGDGVIYPIELQTATLLPS